MKDIAVFGGTGFLGRRIVRHLSDRGCRVRAVARHPPHETPPNVMPLKADISRPETIEGAIAGADAVVNAVSLYMETGEATFRTVHVEAAARLAGACAAAGIGEYLQISGVGADPASDSPYIRARGEGEKAVLAAKPDAMILRPCVMFGPEDGFLSTLASLLPRVPAFPLFGRGEARMRPVYVEDVAEAVARRLTDVAPERLYELAGPRIYTYRQVVETVADELGLRRPILVPTPFSAWKAASFAARSLGRRGVTITEVELMERDNLPGNRPGFAALGIAPTSIEEVLRAVYLKPASSAA
ncbi:complex I NDUFA9 subunit family protein [Afifella pfennigii]|uniref:complex I NDUFA9 subunit family protein n=1 Tax=Afifella pfennigii TaxID=209897 RepID=UPI000554B868|nr:complex I NDUFA9 subunit family protein [Afifella pfennigii]